MSQQDPSSREEEENETTSLADGIAWSVPQDVINEWVKLSPEDCHALSLVLDSVFTEINNTLATVAINTEILPAAAEELAKRLREFRLSLKDMPVGNTRLKKLH